MAPAPRPVSKDSSLRFPGASNSCMHTLPEKGEGFETPNSFFRELNQ